MPGVGVLGFLLDNLCLLGLGSKCPNGDISFKLYVYLLSDLHVF